MIHLEMVASRCRTALARFNKHRRFLFYSFKNDLKIRRLRHNNFTALSRSDLPFYVIFRNEGSAGFFSFLLTFLPEIENAINFKKIPVIDMLNFDIQGISNNSKGLVNYWELIYEQPLGYSLEHAYSSRTLSHSNGCYGHKGILPMDMQWVKDPIFLSQKRSFFRNFIRLKPEVESLIEKSKAVLQGRERLIGVTLRGLDYSSQKPSGHPIQPEINEVIKRCDLLLDSGVYDGIYLACIDEVIVEEFKTRYSQDLFMLPRALYESNITTSKLFSQISCKEAYEEHLLSYVTSIYLLRYCKHIIGGITSSTMFLPLIVGEATTMDFLFYGFYK